MCVQTMICEMMRQNYRKNNNNEKCQLTNVYVKRRKRRILFISSHINSENIKNFCYTRIYIYIHLFFQKVFRIFRFIFFRDFNI